jgi:dTDP-4-dehydrorhamnose 3,5-epimerase
MKATALEVPEVLLLELDCFVDPRGWLVESYRLERYAALGISHTFVQDNASSSMRGVLRGLHFQHPRAQAKLVSVVHGEVFDVAVDVRGGSPTFGRWCGALLSEANRRQLLVPPGFAHGFMATSPHAVVIYKCSEYYSPADERCVRWDDPEIGISWPIDVPLLSPKDSVAPRLRDIPVDQLPPYRG